MSKKGILIQSRLSSSRLPKKMLMKLGKYKLVEFVYKRAILSKQSDMVAIITSKDKSDDELYEFCKAKNIPIFRGSLDNVLERYIEASEFFCLDVIVRVCGDSPFVDVEYIDEQLIIQENEDLDYLGFNKDTIIHGLDSEVIKKDILKSLLNFKLSSDDKEHVTFFIKNNLEKFKYKLIDSVFSHDEVLETRFTVDYEDDLNRCRYYYEKYLNRFNFRLSDIVNAIRKEKECVE